MGFGRIGRSLFRILYNHPTIEVGAISDVADPEAMEYLLKFDTILGRFPDEVRIRDGHLYVVGEADPDAHRRRSRRRGVGISAWTSSSRRRPACAAGSSPGTSIGGEAGHPLLAADRRPGSHGGHGGQRRPAQAGAPDRLERFGDRPLRGADPQDPARGVRRPARLPDHGARLHQPAAPRRRPLGGQAAGARGGREHHPAGDERRRGAHGAPARARGADLGARDERAGAQRLGGGSRLLARAAGHRHRDQRGRAPRPPRAVAADVSSRTIRSSPRTSCAPLLERLRFALHDGHRRPALETLSGTTTAGATRTGWST